MEEFPIIGKLHEQLLLIIGKATDVSLLPTGEGCQQTRETKTDWRSGSIGASASASEESPLLRPIDLNRTDWSRLPDAHCPFMLYSGKEN
ncbi:hypothetical protein EJ110_NYTH08091 [Nymphaea thermarum]|nr:hypothetical protein EJ110_NYTH08091 [Nymphaea thermarum]